MGPGQDPFGHRDDVPHFDRAMHERTQRRQDQRRATKIGGHEVSIGRQESPVGSFFAVTGLLLAAFLVPYTIARMIGHGGEKPGKEKTAKVPSK
jgi:hypothetical protein